MWRGLIWTALFVVALLGASEWYLAYRGYDVDNPNGCFQYKMFDPYLGWKPIVGRNPTMESWAKTPSYETILPDTSRASRPVRQKKASKRVLLLGCSYTYGMSVNDAETFAWKLNERFPDIAFDNFGVFGYGTYQCYLREKQQLLMHPDYDLVLYCAFPDHFNRNTEWTFKSGNAVRDSYYAFAPRVDVDSRGDLCYFDPVRRWPGDTLLRSINFAKRVYYCRLLEESEKHRGDPCPEKIAAFWELNLSMAKEAQCHGAKYALVWLWGNGPWGNVQRDLKELCQRNPWNNPKYVAERYRGIRSVLTNFDSENVPLDYHANNDKRCHFGGKVHSIWAEKIGDWLEEQIKEGMF